MGDLHCRVLVETPIHLTAKQKELLMAFDSSIKDSGTRHSPHSAGWLDGVKKFFENMGF